MSSEKRLYVGTDRGVLETPDPANTILVPDLDARALTAFAKEQCRLTHLDSRYGSWDYLIGLDLNPISGRGELFEVSTWKPNRRVFSRDVRKHFRDQGFFFGHTAAFTAWIAQHIPKGYYASVVEDTACYCSYSDSDGALQVPGFYGGVEERILNLGIRGEYHDEWCFLAFRKLQPSKPSLHLPRT